MPFACSEGENSENMASEFSEKFFLPLKRFLPFSETEHETPIELCLFPQGKHDQEDEDYEGPVIKLLGKKICPSKQPENNVVEDFNKTPSVITLWGKKIFVFKPADSQEPETKPLTIYRNFNQQAMSDFGCNPLTPSKKRFCGTDRENNVKNDSMVAETRTNLVTASFEYIKRSLGEHVVVTDEKLLMERRLKKSDIVKQQGRLALPQGIVATGFLTEYEERWLDGKGNLMEVNVYGSTSLKEHKLQITRWDYANDGGYKYVLKYQWNKFRIDNKLEEGHLIQVWSFRREGRLCFGIVDLEQMVSAYH